MHTSAPCGLFDPAGGYTTVACTAGMPQTLVAKLERSSSLATPRYQSDVPLDQLSVLRIWPLDLDGAWLVVTRVVPVSADFTGRPARLTHHVLLPRGAATGAHVQSLLARADTFRDRWDGAPEALPPRPIPQPTTNQPPSKVIRALTPQPDAWLRRVADLAQTRGGASSAIAVPTGVSRRQVTAEICGRVGSLERLRIASTAEPLDGQAAAVVVIGIDDPLPAGMRWIPTQEIEQPKSPEPRLTAAPVPSRRRVPGGVDLTGLATAPPIGTSDFLDDANDSDPSETAGQSGWMGFAAMGDRTIVLLAFSAGIVSGIAMTLLVAAFFA